jgi:hypothetical protein
MRQRCSKPYSNSFGSYGARGVKVCPEWDSSFPSFRAWAEVSGYADNLSIDRIDAGGNYEPGNCRWADAKMQTANCRPKKNLKLAERDGETLHLSEWARRTGINYTTLVRRYDKGKRGDHLFAPVA